MRFCAREPVTRCFQYGIERGELLDGLCGLEVWKFAPLRLVCGELGGDLGDRLAAASLLLCNGLLCRTGRGLGICSRPCVIDCPTEGLK